MQAPLALLTLIRHRLAMEHDGWLLEWNGHCITSEPPVVLRRLDFEALLTLIDAIFAAEAGGEALPINLAGRDFEAVAETVAAAAADRLDAASPVARELLAGGEAAASTLMGRAPARSPRPDSPYPWDRPRTSAPSPAPTHPGDAP